MAGIYIHIPFCHSRCIYCDFYTQTQMQQLDEYVVALCSEIKQRHLFLNNETCETIYIGGGTPSLLSSRHLDKIFATLHDNFSLTVDVECTMEANPDDINEDYLNAIKNTPINRLSIGIQTFDDSELKFINRRHTARQAIEAVLLSQQKGFENISLDLMYGLPGQSLCAWEKNIETALQLNVPHISAYHLIYEEGTYLTKLLEQDKISEINEIVSNDMFHLLIDKLRDNNIEHYEISNFAKKGRYSKHNCSYWRDKPYLGLGASAHSYNGNARFENVASIEKYIAGITNNNPVINKEILTANEKFNEFIMTRLRTKWGLNMTELKEKFGDNYHDCVKSNGSKYIDSGHLISKNDILMLTDDGIFISDKIMSDLMCV